MVRSEKDMETKADMNNRMKMLMNDNNDLKNQIERVVQTKKNMETDRQGSLGKIKNLEANLAEERKKSGGQKLDLAKEVKVWQAKEHQFVNELRKKELQLQSIQDRMRYVTDKENSHSVKNGLEISQVLIKNGPNFYDGNANSEFTQLIGQNNQSIQAKLKIENRLMRESLGDIQNSLGDIMKTRMDLIQNKFPAAPPQDGETPEALASPVGKDFGLVELRKELLN